MSLFRQSSRWSFRKELRLRVHMEPGRPFGLPGSILRPNESRPVRLLLRGPAFDPHVRDHPAVDVAFGYREPLPVHGDVLNPRLKGVLVKAIDNRDVADVLLD